MVARGGCCGWRSLINHLSPSQMSTFYLLLNLPKTGGKRLILYPAGVLFLNLISFSSDTLLNSVYLSDCFKMYFGVVCIQKKLGSNAVCANGRRQMSPRKTEALVAKFQQTFHNVQKLSPQKHRQIFQRRLPLQSQTLTTCPVMARASSMVWLF